MRELKREAPHWHDFGGVATLDPSDGTPTFKLKRCAQLVTLGVEWRHVGTAYHAFDRALTFCRKGAALSLKSCASAPLSECEV
jgi:hypothetical protein